MTAVLLDGPAIIAAFASATDHLREQAAAIDAINVYPVPDGDTGSNMAATMREAVAHALASPKNSAGEALRLIARGALYGARGNSGVILSQALRGLADGADGADVLDAAILARALRQAATTSYAAVTTPVEGTMLSVMRAAAEGAEQAASTLARGGKGHGCLTTLQAAIDASEQAEARTPEQLPALKEAGVPDSGGEGICVLLRGLAASLTGERPAPVVATGRPLAIPGAHAPEEYGFCTEFVIEPIARSLDVAAVKAAVGTPGNRSVLVVGDSTALHVHVHTDDAEALLNRAALLGRLSRTKVDDMGAQHTRFRESGSGAIAAVAVLAMSPGPGFDRVFTSLGARPAPMLDVLKPAAGDIARAADALGARTVVVLPNHKNVVMAALQAVSLARCHVIVVPTESLPQGIAAAVVFDPSADPAELAEEMEEARGEVATVEITVAPADRKADGVSVQAGDAIALVNGKLILKASTPGDALVRALNRVAESSAGLITIYGGADVDEITLDRSGEHVRALLRDYTVETVSGGQQLYPYIASVER
ncbi:MAG: DAK2 domain-containing protein [Dehalococcoidia bacterium]|nr:DAK2 domain-containing protein [Dehalococcoidia bacterium]